MPEDPKPKGSLTGAGVALVVIGLLVLIPSGLCTGIVGILGILDVFRSGNWNDFLDSLLPVLIFGGVPALLGGALFWAGLSLRKPK